MSGVPPPRLGARLACMWCGAVCRNPPLDDNARMCAHARSLAVAAAHMAGELRKLAAKRVPCPPGATGHAHSSPMTSITTGFFTLWPLVLGTPATPLLSPVSAPALGPASPPTAAAAAASSSIVCRVCVSPAAPRSARFFGGCLHARPPGATPDRLMQPREVHDACARGAPCTWTPIRGRRGQSSAGGRRRTRPGRAALRQQPPSYRGLGSRRHTERCVRKCPPDKQHATWVYMRHGPCGFAPWPAAASTGAAPTCARRPP